MTGLLDGKAAFVTGGAQGIGLAVARAYLQHGAMVTIADVVPEALEAAQHELEREAPGRIAAVRLDVADEAATEAAADAALARFGRLDVSVANAGILVLRRALDLSLADWRRVIDVNLTGAFITSKVMGSRIVAQGEGGSVIMTSSLFGMRGGVENAAYSASKFGMIGLMQCMAAELAPLGVRVNCICPGQMDTPMLDRLFEQRGAEQGRPAADLKAAFVSRIPMGRLGPLPDLADTYVYLASPMSSYMTGQSITVDGGWQVG